MLIHMKSERMFETETKREPACRASDYKPPANKCEMCFFGMQIGLNDGLQVSQHIVRKYLELECLKFI